MTTYLTVEYAPGYGISLHTARRLTDDEKQSYLPEYQDYMLVGTGSDVDLNNITWISLYEFLGKRAPDGEFAGCNNRAYIITQEHNEGGYGYVPHYYYDEEYKRICARLDELKGAI